MVKTARIVAQELYRENQNASVFEIRICTEAEVDSPDPEFVMEVVRAYHRIKAEDKPVIRPAWQGGIVHLPHRPPNMAKVSDN